MRFFKINNGRRKLSDVGEFVAESPDGQDVLRIIHVLFDLRAQAADMNIHGAVGDKRIVAPDMVENLVSGINLAGILGQEEQEFELGGA